MTTLTASQREARRNGRLDQRCRQCGTTSAATECCNHCHSTDVEYREHLPSWSPKRPDLPKVTQWCQQDNTPRVVDPVRRARALAARVPPAQSENAADVISGGGGATQGRLPL